MHSLILGMTESGKSTLAKLLVAKLTASGKHTVILDPLGDPDWKAKIIVTDPDELSNYITKNTSCYVFVDEGGEVFDNGNERGYNWWGTRSRHAGHSFTFMSQRGTGIPKTVRDQCNRLYLFTSSLDDGDIHASEWNKPILARCNVLPQFSFYAANRYGMVERYKIVNFNKIVPDNVESDKPPQPESPKSKKKRSKA